jgi:hypothetical protein
MESEIRAKFNEQERMSSEHQALNKSVSALAEELQQLTANTRVYTAAGIDQAMAQTRAAAINLPLELADRVAAKLDELATARIENLRQVLSNQIEPEIRRDLLEKIKPEIAEHLKVQKQHLETAAEEHILLQYLVEKSGTEVESFYEQLPLRLRIEIKTAIREKLTPSVKEEIKTEIREQLREEEIPAIQQLLRYELANDPTFVAEVRGILKRDLTPEVRESLRLELRSSVESRLRQELNLPVFISQHAQNEGTIGMIIQRHIAECDETIRQGVYEETWKTVTTAILEALGATLPLSDEDDEIPLEEARRALGDLDLETSLKLDRILDTVLSSSKFGNPLTKSRWERYLFKAKMLIDDRLYQIPAVGRANLQPPSGFFRALNKYTCDRSGEQILPGNYYMVLHGKHIAIPVKADIAKELSEVGNSEENKGEKGEIVPPWSGLPFKNGEPSS